MKTKRNALVVVDPQNDFCDHRGSLYVDGAYADMKRLAAHIMDCGERYDNIFVSLDSHDVIAIFHPKFWIGENGEHPAPYTQITPEDFSSRKWRAAAKENETYAARTFKIIEESNLGSVMVWPEHCVISTWGHQVTDTLREALSVWREKTGKAVRYIFKGENPYTDQFSIFEGLDSSYPETTFDEVLFQTISAFDSVTFAGEALSHCVGESVLSYMNRLGGEKQDVFLLTNCTSPVTGFDRQEMLDKLAAKNVQFICTE